MHEYPTPAEPEPEDWTSDPERLVKELEALARSIYYRSVSATSSPPLTLEELTSEAWIAYADAEVRWETEGMEGNFGNYLRRTVKPKLMDAMVAAQYGTSTRTAWRVVYGEMDETSTATIRSMARPESVQPYRSDSDIRSEEAARAESDSEDDDLVMESPIGLLESDDFYGGDPAAVVERRETDALLRQCVDKLNAADADILRSIFGLDRPAVTPTEMAADLGLTLQAICKRRDKALVRLREVALSENLYGVG